METLRDRIIRHEGLRLKPYTDTVGKVTIGVGRNLTDNGISESEAYQMLDSDIANASRQLAVNYLWAAQLDDARHGVLVEMVFQLGMPRFNTFKKFLSCMQRGDYTGAASEMMNSIWAKQCPDRVKELAKIMATGG